MINKSERIKEEQNKQIIKKKEILSQIVRITIK